MLVNYLKTAWRNLAREKSFALVNIAGLAVGMAVCIAILLFVNFELSYDGFHAQADRLYRLRLDAYREGTPVLQRARVRGFVGPELREIFPEIRQSARLINLQGIMGNQVMSRGAASFIEERMYYADPEFLRMFSFPLLEGDPERALLEPLSAVLTESAARKYFGDDPALGKTLVLNGKTDFLVTGVLADVPPNSHLRFDFLLSFATIRNEEYMLGWGDFLTYVLLNPGTDPGRLDAKIRGSDILVRHSGKDSDGESSHLSLQPVRDIHLHSHLEGEAEPNGSAAATYGLLAVALLVLVIAWVNYVNLSIARSSDRAREVGVRKAVGARRGDLVRQFLAESFLVEIVAALAALALVGLAMPAFGRLTGQSSIAAAPLSPALWGILLGFFLLGGWLAGLYPALVMSAWNPVRVLRGRSAAAGSRGGRRRLFLVFQFAASVALAVGAFAVFRQISFMRHQDLGIDIERTLVVKAPILRTEEDGGVGFDVFKTALLARPDVSSVAVSTNIPGRESTWGGSVSPEGDTGRSVGNVDFVGIDYDYLGAFRLPVVAGRAFTREFPSDREAVLLNHSAAERLGLAEPSYALGLRLITWRGAVSPVIGVVQDHHQLSLRHAPIPTVYFLRTSGLFYSLKLAPASRIAETVAAVEREFRRVFPGNPFECFFLDDYFDRQYQADRRFGAVFGFFAGLAILTAGLGLFALAAYAARLRIREIGIRKVLGATPWSLLALQSRDFLFLMGMALSVSLPLAAWGVREWLQNYAYRTPLGWQILILPPAAVVVFALAVVGYQALRAASADPVKSLRYE
jgi:putative ABC transport system permease protein